MSPPAIPLGNGFIVEAQEERIQRLESGVQDISVSVAEHGIKIDALGVRLQDNFDRFGERLEGALRPIGDRLKALDAQQDRQSARLQATEDIATRVKDRMSLAKRAVVPLLLAGSGALAAKFGDWLWTLIHH